MSSSSSTIESLVSKSLVPHGVDSDTCEYIASLLVENDGGDGEDENVREAVMELVRGSVQDEDDNDAVEELCQALFVSLHVSSADNEIGDKRISDEIPRKLDQAVTMKNQQEDPALSSAAFVFDDDAHLVDRPEDSTASTKVAAFYANMIDISSNTAAQSERARRKQRQKELRERMEQEERQRAVDEAMMAMMMMSNDADGNKNNTASSMNHMLDTSTSTATLDVHFKNFDLPNLRGGGPNLLDNASLTLSRGRRYGLMGRNGCGKTTLMTFIASRSVPDAVPQQMNMLLVRQEIMGNDLSAVETVLKSDVKRESVKRVIAWCEDEIQKLEQESVVQVNDHVVDEASKVEATTDDSKHGKSRQKLRDRKRQNMQKAARAKAAASVKTKNEEESKEAKKTRLNETLVRAYERMAQIEEDEGGDPESRARKVLAGLGFSEEMQNKSTKELSGGWRMRVSLSCALFANPSLLLLDEPTNHLDLEAVLWLQAYLTSKFTGTLVVVSHDRHFLNEVVTDVVHFYRSRLTTYRGDISSFEAVRDDDKQRQIRLREIQETKRAHLQKYIDLHAQSGENGPKAARQRKSKMKKLDKLGVMAQDGKKWKASYDGDAEEVEEYMEDDTVELRFPDPGSFDGDIVRLEQVKFGYTPDRILLDDVDLSISLKSRCALLGRNGTGKSTLIKLVVGALRPLKGKAVISGKAKIEYLAQHQLEQLDPDGTPLQTMIDRYPGDHSNSHIGELRRYLANFGLGGEVLPVQKIHTMSGGQKCRVCLAAAMYRKPHLLILDEPTNHLDLETTEALIEAIRQFAGGVLLVSHDQHLLTSVCKDLIVVEKGRIEMLTRMSSNKDAFKEYKKAVVLGRR